MYSVAVTSQEVGYFGALFALVLVGLLASFIFGWWMARNPTYPSPYTNQPLRRGSDLHWLTIEKVLRYLFEHNDYDNRMFDLRRAAICRETGRIFPGSVNRYGNIRVDWDFIKKKYPGNFISWGSLTEEQQLIISDKHDSLEGFQTEFSSHKPAPRDIEKEYVYRTPGPLYVDVETGVLLGWKCVPGTELEVMIVQKSVENYLPGIDSKY